MVDVVRVTINGVTYNADIVTFGTPAAGGFGTSTNPIFVSSGGSGGTADQVQGNVANNAADSGNPVKIGGVARSAAPTAVTAGNRVDATYGTQGQQAIAYYPAGLNASVDGNAAVVNAASDYQGNVVRFATRLEVRNAAGTFDWARGDSSGLWVKPSTYSALGYQQITDATLAGSTALSVPANATVAVLQNLSTTQGIRWRNDGATTAPTSTTGQRIAPGGTLTLDTGNAGLTAARFIREAALGANLEVQFYS